MLQYASLVSASFSLFIIHLLYSLNINKTHQKFISNTCITCNTVDKTVQFRLLNHKTLPSFVSDVTNVFNLTENQIYLVKDVTIAFNSDKCISVENFDQKRELSDSLKISNFTSCIFTGLNLDIASLIVISEIYKKLKFTEIFFDECDFDYYSLVNMNFLTTINKVTFKGCTSGERVNEIGDLDIHTKVYNFLNQSKNVHVDNHTVENFVIIFGNSVRVKSQIFKAPKKVKFNDNVTVHVHEPCREGLSVIHSESEFSD